MKYEEIRKDLKVGDIVLFSGKGAISHSIRLFTLTKWSHIGMILKLPDTDTIFLWEATTLSNLADAIDGRTKKGVQLTLLSERLKSYKGEASLRQLKNVVIERKKYEDLMAFRKKVRNRPYEKSEVELMKAAYDGPFGHNEEDLSSIFCSELVAEAYQRMGLLSEDKPSNEYIPKDFTEGKNLKLLGGASLGKEIMLKM